MDGRLKAVLAGGLVAAVGCSSTPKQLSDVAKAPVEMPKASQVANAPPPQPAEPPRTTLKPQTYIAMGALTEQAAQEQERPQAERDGFRQQARQSYQKALEVDPKFAPAYVALGASYLAEGDREHAQAMFKKATDLAPKDAALWSELGAVQAKGKDWQSAIASFQRAAELEPGSKSIETRLGFTLARAGRYEEALNVLVRVMSEAEARYNVARMMIHNNETTAANVQLQLALKSDPGFEVARQLLENGTQAVQQVDYRTTSLPPVQLGGAGR
jgi:tetratricopeptide (TPR) repeat protein